ncbi:hypothetical protein LX70_03975 [Defluviimonas denitrificans]|jgi:hypothetical protein|uniref:Uncharacterized protein n=1 Tax=Albidovulum denitrificans TaxID=404881 RepID=A0A2S8RWF2_9RHOB|nr:hypothetical protein [Defluviimonas denitrificans]PQV52869.1 hypothetical protein LX70_03975 [Defluviimonas denitrificans]
MCWGAFFAGLCATMLLIAVIVIGGIWLAAEMSEIIDGADEPRG